jgi:hypothetical protein
MGLPRLTYNSKTIDLPAFENIDINAFIEREINRSLTRDVETIVHPAPDIHVRVNWYWDTTSGLREQLENWWQWAQRGNAFRFVVDSAKTVKTTLSAQEAAGQTVLSLTSVSGISAGNYVLIGGPYYQLVTVTSVGASDVTINSALDYTFPSGSVFRDEYLWDGIIRDKDQRSPIVYTPLNKKDAFEFHLDFCEDIA